MSLRAFHIFFVIFVGLLFMFLSYWNYMDWKSLGDSLSLSYMLISLVLTVLTVVYGAKFYNKTRIIGD